jgi:predicted GIY-YIG superfamily endonuclease
VSNKKAPHRKGKVQLINALELYEKLRKNLGQKNCEMTASHIEQLTQLYIDFKETDISKIFPNEYFGYNKITVERPLRLSCKFTAEAMESLRYEKAIRDEMEWAYTHMGESVYTELKKHKDKIEKHLANNEIKLSPANKTKLLSQEHWNAQLELMQAAEQLAKHFGDKQFDDYNSFVPLLNKTVKELKLELDAKALKTILDCISWRNEDAERVIDKTDKASPERNRRNGTVHYVADSELRDTENVPLDQDIHEYFEREVLQHIPDLPALNADSGLFCVYVLKCADGSFYKGQTNNIKRRLEEHRKGEVSWTSKNLPILLVHCEQFQTREEAVKREDYLKTGRGREWIKVKYDKRELNNMGRQAGAWIDESKTVKGYEISFTRYFYNYVPPRSIEEITAEIFALEKETEGILNQIVND